MAQSGLAENVVGALCFVLGWITGIVFLVIDKRPYVRFHAAQSLIVFGGLHILQRVVAGIFGFGWLIGGWGLWPTLGLGGLLLSALSLLTFILWILLMIKAFQGEKFRVPLAADIADQIAGK